MNLVLQKGRRILKHIPGLPYAYDAFLGAFSRIVEIIKISILWLQSFSRISWDPSSNMIVSLTSFPARIDHAWIAIESLFQQDFRPWKVVLVLSEEEFPLRILPRAIRRQQSRGLEILWTPSNIRSFKKLLPTRAKYPNAVIVTADDDLIYESWRLQQLHEASKRLPGCIIGHRGWQIVANDNCLAPYVSWLPAGPHTPSACCFLTGAGTILYPPHLLPFQLLLDDQLALKLCPLADDIWFWAVALKAGVPCYCLGNHEITGIFMMSHTPKLYTNNYCKGGNDIQIKAVIDFFGLHVPTVFPCPKTINKSIHISHQSVLNTP